MKMLLFIVTFNYVLVKQNAVKKVSLLFFVTLVIIALAASAQADLSLSRADGLKVIVISPTYPLLKVLLPGQPSADRGVEIEFPEHVTGLNLKSNTVEHLYLVSRGTNNKRALPAWSVAGNSLIYKSDLDSTVTLTARITFERDGLRYTYKMNNHSKRSYQNLQAVTCVKLYSAFSDTLLERTYVHHPQGFELLASETPERLTMGLERWLPCRYLVSYSWPVNPVRVQKGEDGITRYNKSKKADLPVIATLSHDKHWIAATYTKETGNLWTNPERSCHHADPSVDLSAGQTRTLELNTFLIKGDLAKLQALINKEMQHADH